MKNSLPLCNRSDFYGNLEYVDERDWTTLTGANLLFTEGAAAEHATT